MGNQEGTIRYLVIQDVVHILPEKRKKHELCVCVLA